MGVGLKATAEEPHESTDNSKRRGRKRRRRRRRWKEPRIDINDAQILIC